MTWKSENTLYLDMDGVLADFDKSARILCGMEPRNYEERYGTDKFWETINSDPSFFINLEVMPGIMELYDVVKHLEPIILTGIPRGMNSDSNQKHEWVKKILGPYQKVICCQASKKWKYIYEKGDILIDDRYRNMKKWNDHGGIFILHKSVKQSIQKLKEYGVI